MSKIQKLLSLLLVSVSLAATPVLADDSDDGLDVSLKVLDDGDTSEDAVENLEVPEDASDVAKNVAAAIAASDEAGLSGKEKADAVVEAATANAQETINNLITQGKIPEDVKDKLPPHLVPVVPDDSHDVDDTQDTVVDDTSGRISAEG